MDDGGETVGSASAVDLVPPAASHDGENRLVAAAAAAGALELVGGEGTLPGSRVHTTR